MSETVREWMAKAEGDFQAALSLMRVRKHPNYDAVAFHAQQCIEKLLKGALIRRKTVPPKIHNLVELSALLHKAVASWDWDATELDSLSRAAVIL